MQKVEYPPLLPLGFHEKSLAELRGLCVEQFDGRSKTRSTLMQGLEQVIASLLNAKIVGKVWVDGSFLSNKIDPQDVDILVEIQGSFYDVSTPEQRQILKDLDDNVYKSTLAVDSRSWNFYDDVSGPAYWDSVWWRGYWLKLFGFYSDAGPNSTETKGIALLTLPGCDK